MSVSRGRFIWYELMTTDREGAKAFYGPVVDWGAQDVPSMPYTLFTAGERPVSGAMLLPEEARQKGAPPRWIGYVSVDDVDAVAERAKHLGGTIHVTPRDIPNICRFAVIGDPQRAVLSLMKWASPAQDQPPEQELPGRTGWHELRAADWEAAFGFYGELFGWQKTEAIDMGPMGTYQLFSAGGPPIGGMFTKPETVPVPSWLYYFNVGDIDEAAGRVTAGGGHIHNGPMQVPGGGWIIHGLDPQGAMFALYGKRG
jgi:uncharacterized protein